MTAEQRVALVDAIAALRYRQARELHGAKLASDLERSAHVLERMLLGDPALPAPRGAQR